MSNENKKLRWVIRPYGEDLLDQVAKTWLLFAFLMTLLTSTAEGGLWSAIMFLQFESSWFAGIITFIVAFTMIWMTDISIVLYDFSTINSNGNREYFNNKIINAIVNLLTKFFATKIGWGVIGRIIVMTLAILITAPALIYILLNNEVNSEIQKENFKKYSEIENMVRSKHEPIIRKYKADKKRLSELYLQEITGKGGSGNKGVGKIAEAIKTNRDEVSKNLSYAIDQLHLELSSIHNTPIKKLENKYKVKFSSSNSFNQKMSKVFAIMKDPKYKTSVMTVEGIVIFIFLLFIMLKLFQPRSVAVYLNASIQENYRHWRKGNFDSFLPDELQSSNDDVVGPIGFEEKIHSIVRSKTTLSDTELMKLRAEVEIHARKLKKEQLNLDEIIAYEKKLYSKVNDLKNKEDETFKSLEDFKCELRILEKTQGKIESWLIDIEKEESKLSELIPASSDPEMISKYLKSREISLKNKQDERSNVSRKINELGKDINILTKREEKIAEELKRVTTSLEKLPERLNSSNSSIRSIEDKIDQIKLETGGHLNVEKRHS